MEATAPQAANPGCWSNFVEGVSNGCASCSKSIATCWNESVVPALGKIWEAVKSCFASCGEALKSGWNYTANWVEHNEELSKGLAIGCIVGTAFSCLFSWLCCCKKKDD